MGLTRDRVQRRKEEQRSEPWGRSTEEKEELMKEMEEGWALCRQSPRIPSDHLQDGRNEHQCQKLVVARSQLLDFTNGKGGQVCQWSQHSFLLLSLVTEIRASRVVQTVKNLPAMWETQVPSLGWEDPLENGNGYPLQYSDLENSTDRGAWQSAVHGVSKSLTQLSNFHFHYK